MTLDTVIFSIGHGARRLEDFLQALKRYEIEYVIDVRSSPKSRFNPHFNLSRLHESLKANGIGYVHLGENLGGRPKDPSCYDELGRVDYQIVATKEFYKQGISRIFTAYEKRIRVACMCSEILACECHRSKLIGETLRGHGIGMQHITKNGEIEDQTTVMDQLAGGKITGDMFGEATVSKSRKIYK